MKLEKLSNLVDISIGRTPSRSKSEYWGKGYKWVSIRDLSSKIIYDTKEEITDTAVKETRCKPVPKGTLLFSFKLTIGKMAFTGEELFTNEAIAAFSIKNKNQLNKNYLYYALQTAKLVGSNQAVMGKTLNLKSLAEIKIPIPQKNNKPDITTQTHIVHLLSRVEGLIVQRKQHLQELDKLISSVFLEMFGDPVRNEKEWDKLELKQFGKISTGNTPPRKDASNYLPKHIEWIKTSNISSDSMSITEAAEYLSKSGEKKGRVVKNGALLVACIAGSIESIGRAALTNRTVAFNQQINAIQPKEDVNPTYLYALFKISRAYIQNHASKGMKKIITKGDFEKITMIKPPFDIQNEFAEIVEKVEGIKARYQQSLTELENLYGVLSQQAFKGELDLSRITVDTSPPELIAEKDKKPKSYKLADLVLEPSALDKLSGTGMKISQIERSIIPKSLISPLVESVAAQESSRIRSLIDLPDLGKAARQIEQVKLISSLIDKPTHQAAEKMKSLTGLTSAFQNINLSPFAEAARQMSAIDQVIPKMNLDLTSLSGISEHLTNITSPYASALEHIKQFSSDDWESMGIDWAFNDYLDEMGDEPFTIEKCTAFVEDQLHDEAAEEPFKLSKQHYEHIKTLLFEALDDGHLIQNYHDQNNKTCVFRNKETET